MKLWALAGLIPLSLAECNADKISFFFLGGVRNEEFCLEPGHCNNLPSGDSGWSERAELFRIDGNMKTCAAFFKSYDCPEGIDDVDVFQGGCSDEIWGRYFPKNWTHGVIKSYRVWYKTE